MQKLDIEQFRKVLPKNLKMSLRQEMIDNINNVICNEDIQHNYRDNLLGYTNVLKDGRFQLQDYINAVKYVSYKMMGSSNIVAYAKTFPDRYKRLVDIGTPQKDIASHITSYSKNKLVNLVLEQTLIPSYILNNDLYQKALNTQAELMMYAKSEKVRCDAANSLLTQLKMPETRKVDLNIGLKEDSTIEELRQSTLALVAQQRLMIENNLLSAKEIANSKLVIEGECE